MGKWKNGWVLNIAGWGSVGLITAMDVYGLVWAGTLSDAWHVLVGGK